MKFSLSNKLASYQQHHSAWQEHSQQLVAILAVLLLALTALSFYLLNSANMSNNQQSIPKIILPPLQHTGITATVFWAGEGASSANADISNRGSAWVDDWVTEFGGIDAPTGRQGYWPSWGKPKQNPFYAAIPYNDYIYGKDTRKATAKLCLEVSGNQPSEGSWCKNTWITVEANNRTVYAQIEDVGPAFEDSAAGEDDIDYVFQGKTPRNAIQAVKQHNHDNVGAGLDLSPAVRDYLFPGNRDGENGTYKDIKWRFVKTTDVPKGPWTQIITTSPGRPAK